MKASSRPLLSGPLSGLLRNLALAAPLILSGCASGPAGHDELLWRDAAYRAPASPLPSAAELLALSPAMQAFASREFATVNPMRDRREALIEALYRAEGPHKLGLRLEYDATVTRTAAEAFETRAGNCLSLVMMTAAFAQHLGLVVTYQDVRTELQYTRQGSLTVASGHVNLVLGPRPSPGTVLYGDNRGLVVDFLAAPDASGLRATPIRQERIVAMYFNNRAGELLAEVRTDEAYWHAREALKHDPGFLNAINTLGVIHERAGQTDAAEAAFRHVRTAQPKATAALSNLVALLRRQGRTAEAEPLAAELAALQPEPPLYHYALGLAALEAGEAATAAELFRRELRRQPEHDEVHVALARALAQLGDVEGARFHLARAVEYSLTRADRERYGNKLATLKASARATRLQ